MDDTVAGREAERPHYLQKHLLRRCTKDAVLLRVAIDLSAPALQEGYQQHGVGGGADDLRQPELHRPHHAVLEVQRPERPEVLPDTNTSGVNHSEPWGSIGRAGSGSLPVVPQRIRLHDIGSGVVQMWPRRGLGSMTYNHLKMMNKILNGAHSNVAMGLTYSVQS